MGDLEKMIFILAITNKEKNYRALVQFSVLLDDAGKGKWGGGRGVRDPGKTSWRSSSTNSHCTISYFNFHAVELWYGF